jgi:predicted enzyme related to lactoylglutathione lyase
MSDVTEAPLRAANEDATTPAQGALIWYELMTTDADGARAFYEKVVPGWTLGERIPGDTDYRMIGRSDGGFAGGLLKLTDEMEQGGARPIWLGYIGVDDVDATVARIEGKGGKALMPAFDIPQGRIAMVADPQGVPFYVMKPVPPEGKEKQESDVFSPTEEQRVAWNELATTNQTAALDFYTSLFGWTAGDKMPMGDLGDYQFINRSDVMLGAMMTAAPGNPARWRYYIRVPDIAAAAEKVKEAGGVVAHGPMEVPGGDKIIIGFDPQGAEFALVGK